MALDDPNKTPTWEITGEDIQRYIRIVGYVGSGYLLKSGVQSSWVELLGGLFYLVANFGWSLYGMRINAKLAEIAKLGRVREVILDTHAAAAEIPSPKVVGPIVGR